MAFYNERNTAPEKFYPKGADGKARKYDDLPLQFRANIDDKDAPFDPKFDDKPAMTDQDIRDIMAFLKTLTARYLATQSQSTLILLLLYVHTAHLFFASS